MTAKEWRKLTIEEADEKLLSIMNELNGDVFAAFCVKDPETRTGIDNGVLDKKEAISAGRVFNHEFASYTNEECAKEAVNTIFAEHHKDIAKWLTKGLPPICIKREMGKAIGVRFCPDGSEIPVTVAAIHIGRDTTLNPDGYGFLVHPLVLGVSR